MYLLTYLLTYMALTFYRDTPEPVGQQASFLVLMAEYDMDIQYCGGCNHANCDALSRIRWMRN